MHGRRRRRLRRSRAAALDFGNSGTGCRLVMGAVAGCPITATFDGDASLRKRPMRRILDPLAQMGARSREPSRRRAAAADARRARAIRCRSSTSRRCRRRRSSRRCCSPASPRRARPTVIEKRGDARPHREDAAPFRRRGDGRAAWRAWPAHHAHRPAGTCRRAPVVVPADPSSAAFPLVAALIVPGSD